MDSIHVSRGGVPKGEVAECAVGPGGLTGDRQNDTAHHGGPERAVCVFSLEVIRALQAEGHPIGPGTAGENFTVSGIDWAAVGPGSRLTVGEVELEVTRHTSPCATIAGSFRDGRFDRISQKTHPGWSRVYARVVRGGFVRRGDSVALS